jgi:hypothetical protein
MQVAVNENSKRSLLNIEPVSRFASRVKPYGETAIVKATRFARFTSGAVYEDKMAYKQVILARENPIPLGQKRQTPRAICCG